MLALNCATIGWDDGGYHAPVLENVDFQAPRGTWTCVIGRNGSGKSTLLLALAGLLPVTPGGLTVDGQPLEQVNSAARLVLGRGSHQIVGSTPAEDIAWGLQLQRLAPDAIRRRTAGALEAFNLVDIAEQPIHLLSGGQLQRVALAGAWAMKPGWILADEPTSMLDPDHQERVLDLLATLRDGGVGIVHTTHSLEEMERADRVWLVDGGRVIPLGTPEEAREAWERIAEAGFPKPWKWKVMENMTVPPRAEEDSRRPKPAGPDPGVHPGAAAGQVSWIFLAGVLQGVNSGKPGPDPRPQDAEPIATLTDVVVEGRLQLERCELYPGITALLGPSGAGKTTLLALLGGLLQPNSGNFHMREGDPYRARRALTQLRQNAAMALQFPEQQLFAPTVYEDMAYALRRRGLRAEEVDKRVRTTASDLGLTHLLERSPFTLSFGEQRRVALGGILALNPRILLLDEPFAGIDSAGRTALAGLLKNWAKRTGGALVVASHHIEELLDVADRWWLLEGGRLTAAGSLSAVARAASSGGDHPIAAAKLRVAARWSSRV
ncbi:ABC transporter ATP-binding protein [Kyrpidia spormannii]|nr:ABC transporter ATP-binding protein [Kyrpidia spormannii]